MILLFGKFSKLVLTSHIHIYTHIHTYIYTHTHIHTYTRTHICKYTRTHIRKYTRTDVHMYSHHTYTYRGGFRISGDDTPNYYFFEINETNFVRSIIFLFTLLVITKITSNTIVMDKKEKIYEKVSFMAL